MHCTLSEFEDLHMTKKELIEALASQSGVDRKQVELVLKALPEAIKAELKDKGESAVYGLGTFKVSDRAARMGKNPQTGQPLQIAARKAVTMKPASDIRQSVQ
ncbi:HU family DNA-binding protein [Pseudomonas fluorescens]|uniref:HU family DNA-binding protein n=1 Tax=Pseudomonas viridiflava TaxID=33069 RepID=UPI0013CEE27F|nr:HU family DNA-binding protein [Pseudomonas fluorescens]MBD8615244.1 HU family DNA-binding protein [Pseudomonas putida]MBD8682103.1 HU family DNA-binding protein [Pseudomonas sp. CFBP 13719]